MKHFTLFVAALTAATVCQAQPKATRTAPHSKSTLAVRQQGLHARKAAAKASQQWLSRIERLYLYEEGEWVEYGKYINYYDSEGNLTQLDEISPDGDVLRTIYERTQTSLVETSSTSSDGENFTYSSKKVREYDPTVTSLATYYDNLEWNTLTNEWVTTGSSYKRTVTRNADGNVTMMVLATPYNGQYDDTQRVTNTFDPQTKQATGHKYEALGYNAAGTDFEWQTEMVLENMAWHQTNGQLVGGYDSFMQTGNLLSHADVMEAAGDDVIRSAINITYGDTDDNWTETYLSGDNLYYSVTTQTVDANTGSGVYEYKYYEDLDGDGTFADTELTVCTKETATYDAQGNNVLSEVFMLNDEGAGTEQTQGTKTEYTYDAEHGNAIKEQIEYEYNYETKTYDPYARVVTEEFVDITAALHDVKTTTATATEVYNLHGAKVGSSLDGLPHGLYIVKKDGRTVKTVK